MQISFMKLPCSKPVVLIAMGVVVILILNAVSSLPAESKLPAASDEIEKATQQFQSGKVGSAEKHYQKALKVEPNNPYAMMGVGQCLSSRGKTDEALDVMHRLTKQHPGFAPAYYTLGTLYETKGDIDQAKHFYRQYVEKSGGKIPPVPEMRLKLRHMGAF
ncbi:MAG: tetratricopeptide repeat protein [Vampirovibrio sp.]|nr:tetratricopeptide repeat protein [Vampirovibrio sp.]